MPKEFKSYGCAFQCGQRHSEKKKYIENHEKLCHLNPENKTCITCGNELIENTNFMHLRSYDE